MSTITPEEFNERVLRPQAQRLFNQIMSENVLLASMPRQPVTLRRRLRELKRRLRNAMAALNGADIADDWD